MKQVLKALSLLIEMQDTTLDEYDLYVIRDQHTSIVENHLSPEEYETYVKMAQAYFDVQDRASNPYNIVVAEAYNAEHLIDFLNGPDGPAMGTREELEYIKDNVSEDGYLDGSHVKDIFIRLYGPIAQREIRLMECSVVMAVSI